MKLLEELEAASVAATPPMSDLLRRAIDELTAQDVTIGNLEALCHELKDRSAHAVPDGWRIEETDTGVLIDHPESCLIEIDPCDRENTLAEDVLYELASAFLPAAPKPPESTSTTHEGEKS